MSKPKKKRSKRYQGSDARQHRPKVIRVEAVKRSKQAQWWHDNRRRVSIGAAITAVAAILALVFFELLRILFGW